MKISVDGKELFTLNETKKKVIQNDVLKEKLEGTLKGLIVHVLEHKFKKCFERLKAEWEPKLIQSGEKEVFLDKEKFAKQVFKHPDYKSRSQKMAAKDKKDAIEVKPEKEEK
jgi:hypothetical protein